MGVSKEILDLRIQDHAEQVRRLREVWTSALADLTEAGVLLPMVVVVEIDTLLLKPEQRIPREPNNVKKIKAPGPSSLCGDRRESQYASQPQARPVFWIEVYELEPSSV